MPVLGSAKPESSCSSPGKGEGERSRAQEAKCGVQGRVWRESQQGRRDAGRGEAAAWCGAQCVQGPGNGVCKGQSRGSQVWTSVCSVAD